jgi:hypothetical protein
MTPIWIIVIAAGIAVLALWVAFVFASDPEGRTALPALASFAGAVVCALFALGATATNLWRYVHH